MICIIVLESPNLNTIMCFSAPWVKVYLVSGKRCLAKAKTTTARRTLEPLYQQQLVFHEKYQGCVLQVKSNYKIKYHIKGSKFKVLT